MKLITAKIDILLPFNTVVKEGDYYEPINILLGSSEKITIYPLEPYYSPEKEDFGKHSGKRRRIVIKISLLINSEDTDFNKRTNQKPFLSLADKYINMLIAQCKSKTGQFWWPRLEFGDFNTRRFRYVSQFINAEDGTVLYQESGTVDKVSVLGKGLHSEVWKKIKQEMESNKEPSIVDHYLVEGQSALFNRKLDIFAVNLAMAVEIFVSRYCLLIAKKLGKDNEAKFRGILSGKTGFVIKYFKKILPFLTQRILYKENKKTLSYNRRYF